jgi:hypothetical protein
VRKPRDGKRKGREDSCSPIVPSFWFLSVKISPL